MSSNYIPTAALAQVQKFEQFAGTVSAFSTALIAAFGGSGVSIQVNADTTAGQTANAVVIINDQQVFTVAPNNWVGYNGGVWTQWTPAQMAGGASSKYTPYTG